mmetsp:Transcript_10074/g.14967  ORF Transcript_10074/g.14967 Transcript_10074/m.14967 type:complete len:694 (+) Transcript_10074:940-3021(+)
MISNAYCIISVIGVGIAGRVFAEGAQNPRSLLLEAYELDSCALHQVWVNMECIKDLFSDSLYYLKAGLKKEMIMELCTMLHFVNNDRQGINNNINAVNSKRLVVSKGKKLNSAAQRRQKASQDERDSIQTENVIEAIRADRCKRKHNLVFQCGSFLSGFIFVCMVHEYDDNPGVLCFRLYHPNNSVCYEIRLEAASLSAKINVDDRETMSSLLLQKELNSFSPTATMPHNFGTIDVKNEKDETSDTVTSRLIWRVGGRFGTLNHPLPNPYRWLPTQRNDKCLLQRIKSTRKTKWGMPIVQSAYILYPFTVHEPNWDRCFDFNSCTRKRQSVLMPWVGCGKVVVSGAVHVGSKIGIFRLHRCGKGGHWYLVDGQGDQFDLYLYIPSIENEFRFRLGINDLFRVCRGTNLMDTVLSGDDDSVAIFRIQGEEEAAYASDMVSMADTKSSCDEKTTTYEDEKSKIEINIKKSIMNAAYAWREVAVRLISHCMWYDKSYGSNEENTLNGQMTCKRNVMPWIDAERMCKGTMDEKEDMLALDCTIYSKVHTIASISTHRTNPRQFLITAYQQNNSLRFLAHDIDNDTTKDTGEYMEFSHSEEEQSAMIESLRDLSVEEADALLSGLLQEALYQDDDEGNFKIGFIEDGIGDLYGGGTTINIQLTDEEMRRETRLMDEKLLENVRKVRNRVHTMHHFGPT